MADFAPVVLGGGIARGWGRASLLPNRFERKDIGAP